MLGGRSETARELKSRIHAVIPGGAHTYADMVKFTKDGSTTTTAAVKLARAYTGRDKVAICADHPFFSYDDWYIATTDVNAGIPKDVSPLSLGFRYNDIASMRALFAQHHGENDCVIL